MCFRLVYINLGFFFIVSVSYRNLVAAIQGFVAVRRNLEFCLGIKLQLLFTFVADRNLFEHILFASIV